MRKAYILCWIAIFAATYVLGALHQPAWLIGLSVFAIWLFDRMNSSLRPGSREILYGLLRKRHYLNAVRFWFYAVSSARVSATRDGVLR